MWGGRFKSQPIQKELYLSACGRYIERNPVKANMIGLAWEYSYSSASYYVTGKSDDLTSESPLFSDFGDSIEERRSKYKDYLTAFNTEEESFFENLVLPQGNKEFIKRLHKENGHYFPRNEGEQVRNCSISL